MNALTHISGFGGNDQPQTMSSREIAEICETRHNQVVETIERLFAKGVLRESRKTTRTHRPDGGGRPTEVYDLTKRDTLVVASGYNEELRARIIDRWQELEETIRGQMIALPQDYASALRALADESEKSQALKAQIEQDAPKVAFADQVEAAPDAITLAQAAKILGTGRNRLAARLRELGWITRLGEPYQEKINAGLMDVKIGSWDHPDKGLQRSVTPLITGKGLAKLHKIFAMKEAA